MNVLAIPAGLCAELSGDVDVLKVLDEVMVAHPENTVNLLIRFVAESLSSLLGPLI